MKHLNPRQGITTPVADIEVGSRFPASVKHLNPRQGITTSTTVWHSPDTSPTCETPKSPPGDYNPLPLLVVMATDIIECETPKSPPGDYNNTLYKFVTFPLFPGCETPKSPPGDYNISGYS